MEKSVGSLASYTRGRATDYNGPFHPSAAPSALLSLPPPCLPPPYLFSSPFLIPSSSTPCTPAVFQLSAQALSHR